MDDPIKFYLPMNGDQYNEIEYYVDRNGDCSFKVNNERVEQMLSGPPPPELPEFKRGDIISDFSGTIKSTTFELYDYKENTFVQIKVQWS